MPRTAKPVDPIEAAFTKATGGAAKGRELTDGAIRCSIEGCGGIVKKDYVLTEFSEQPIGMCAQKSTHQLLMAHSPAVKTQVSRMLTLYTIHCTSK